MNKGGNRIIGGGVQNRFWDGFYGMLSPLLSFPPPLFLSKSAHADSEPRSENCLLYYSKQTSTIPQVLQTHIHIYTCTHTHVHTYCYIYIYIHTRIHTHTHIHTYTHTHIHTHTHTHTHTPFVDVSNRRSRFAAVQIAIGSQRFKIARFESLRQNHSNRC